MNAAAIAIVTIVLSLSIGGFFAMFTPWGDRAIERAANWILDFRSSKR